MLQCKHSPVNIYLCLEPEPSPSPCTCTWPAWLVIESKAKGRALASSQALPPAVHVAAPSASVFTSVRGCGWNRALQVFQPWPVG